MIIGSLKVDVKEVQLIGTYLSNACSAKRYQNFTINRLENASLSVQLKTFLIGHSIKILSLKVLITKTNLEWFANYPQHPDDGNISGASMKTKHIPHRMN